jgi:hypothetical protein
MDDSQAYQKYPQHRKWFNKLYIAELFQYDCGPAGVAPTKDGTYVVRPIYNLSGMGIGAHVKQIKAGDVTSVPAGYFWCEYFIGKHYSATYDFCHDTNPYWKPISCWEGFNTPINLTKFVEWKTSTFIPKVPRQLNALSNVGRINIEFIDDKVIEVHLRESPDPDANHLVPIWKSTHQSTILHYQLHGFEFISSYDDADGQLDDPRLGFMIK